MRTSKLSTEVSSQIRLYEELSLNSHVSLKTQFYDGWVIRYANGYTNRANSVNMLYPSTLDLQRKISHCEDFYEVLGRPCVFKVTDDNYIDKVLEQRGYQLVTPTDLMIMNLRDKEFRAFDAVVTDHVTDEWLQAYYVLEHCTNLKTQDTIKQILDLVQNQCFYCRIVDHGKTIACASTVIERGYMALLNVIVDEQYRGCGYGQRLCETLLSKAKEAGAHTAYLQVVQNNHVAHNLYEKLGYVKIYSYWYRVQEQS